MVHGFFLGVGEKTFCLRGEGEMPKISNMTYRDFLWNFYCRKLLNFDQQPFTVTTFFNANGL